MTALLPLLAAPACGRPSVLVTFAHSYMHCIVHAPALLAVLSPLEAQGSDPRRLPRPSAPRRLLPRTRPTVSENRTCPQL